MEDRGLTPSGIALAVIVHGLLLLLLVIGVSWRSSPPQVVQAALWSEIPGPAAQPKKVAPPPKPEPKPKPEPVKPKVQPKPEPEPLPPKEINQKVEPVKKPPKVEKKPPEVQPEPKPVPQDKPKPPDRKAHAQAMSDIDKAAEAEAAERAQQQAAAKAAASKAAQDLALYKQQVEQRIRANTAFNDPGGPNLSVAYRITIALATREILLEPDLVSSSGNPAFDEAVKRAILLMRRLPEPPTGVKLERESTIRYKLREEP